MLSPNELKYLRSVGHREPVVVQIGKQGLMAAVERQADEALTARELIKIRVLKNAPDEPAAVAGELASRTAAQLVQVVGRVGLLYRAHPEAPQILNPPEL